MCKICHMGHAMVIWNQISNISNIIINHFTSLKWLTPSAFLKFCHKKGRFDSQYLQNPINSWPFTFFVCFQNQEGSDWRAELLRAIGYVFTKERDSLLAELRSHVLSFPSANMDEIQRLEQKIRNMVRKAIFWWLCGFTTYCY